MYKRKQNINDIMSNMISQGRWLDPRKFDKTVMVSAFISVRVWLAGRLHCPIIASFGIKCPYGWKGRIKIQRVGNVFQFTSQTCPSPQGYHIGMSIR